MNKKELLGKRLRELRKRKGINQEDGYRACEWENTYSAWSRRK